MPAAYDTYDYPLYWIGRDYEHQSELYALRSLLKKIPKIKNIIDIGAGYGRLTKTYDFRAKKVILTDPSSSLLKIARSKLKGKKYSFVHSTASNLYGKIKKDAIDLVVIVRVLHHIKDLDSVFRLTNKILKKNGYIILEFANKCHLKATAHEFLKGNFTFKIDLFPKNLKRSEKNHINFLNFHPDEIRHKLFKNGYEIIEERSVSNLRDLRLKKIFPTSVLLYFEKRIQKPLSKISFGPSVFILAKRKY